MDIRERILQAALLVFGEAGYLGATTRRIAQEAGVNEVTLFRHFGSKEELIREAVRGLTATQTVAPLPEEPRDPERELAAWTRDHIRHLYDTRSVVRTCMSECEKHAEFSSYASEQPRRVMLDLTGYLLRLQERGMARPDFDANFASAMLMGAIFGDVMGRDMMPEMFGYGVDDGAAEYVALFLRAIGARPQRRRRRAAAVKRARSGGSRGARGRTGTRGR